MNPYSTTATHYGWGTLLPLPENRKTPPPKGCTGADAKHPSQDRLAKWANHQGNVALKLPDDVVGIDVDEYSYLDPTRGPVRKAGLKTLRQLERELGQLPATWVSTGRNHTGGSGIRFFRLPAGYAGQVQREGGGPCVDIIRTDHRYAVVWPSVVKDARGDRVYQWFTPDGDLAQLPPQLHQLAELPEPWAEWLCTSDMPERDLLADTGPLELDPDEIDPVYARDYCARVIKNLEDEAVEALLLEEGERTTNGNGWEKVVANAAYYMHRIAMTPHSGYDEDSAWAKLQEIVPEAMHKTASYSLAHKWRAQADPAALKGGSLMVLTEAQLAAREFAKVEPLPVVQDTTQHPTAPYVPEKKPRFDPDVLEPSDLAGAILEFMRDTYVFVEEQQSWYKRDDNAGFWRRMAGSQVQGARALLNDLSAVMPRGRRDSDDPELKAQGARWTAVAAPSRRGGTAALILDKVSNQATVESLLTRPDLLWAGGWCWDLRASRQQPTLAQDVDLMTPHTATASVVPAVVPTPLMDEMMATMFPDPELRAYVWHLFGASLTGKSDRMLCVIYGETGVGKTTLVELMSRVMGNYAQPMASKLLDPQRCTEFDRMDLMGVRMASVDEGPRDNRSGQEHLKDLTGGGRVRGAVKGKPSVSFRPTHTLWFTDNREPSVSDPAVLSRVRAVPVAGTQAQVAAVVSRIRQDEDAWLAEEGPGILAKLMACAGDYLADRSVCDQPAGLQAEMEQLAKEQDPVGQWLAHCVDPCEGGETSTQAVDLYRHFRGYAESIGTPRNQLPALRWFGRQLVARGLPRHRTKRGITYAVKIRDDAWE